MANPKQTRVQTDNEEINRLQDSIKRGTPDTSPLAAGNRTDPVEFTSPGQSIEVPHKLGQPSLGATCVGCNAPSGFSIEESDVDTSRYIKITATAAVTARFWVF